MVLIQSDMYIILSDIQIDKIIILASNTRRNNAGEIVNITGLWNVGNHSYKMFRKMQSVAN